MNSEEQHLAILLWLHDTIVPISKTRGLRIDDPEWTGDGSVGGQRDPLNDRNIRAGRPGSQAEPALRRSADILLCRFADFPVGCAAPRPIALRLGGGHRLQVVVAARQTALIDREWASREKTGVVSQVGVTA